MKKQCGSRTRQHVSKEGIIDNARKGVYDRNPLLAISHQVVCKNCGCTQKITYLDQLKNGSFELGKREAVEVAYAAPTITGLSHSREMMTPVIIRTRCQKCDEEIFCSPLSLEYLLFTSKKEQNMEHMYV